MVYLFQKTYSEALYWISVGTTVASLISIGSCFNEILKILGSKLQQQNVLHVLPIDEYGFYGVSLRRV